MLLPFQHQGQVLENTGRKLQYAQGKVIPTLGRRDVAVRLKDLRGRDICLKERVTISTGISQPIFCYGKLMEAGWSLDAQQQVMYHPQHDIQIPVDMQHRSLTLTGHIRMIQEEPHVVRMMKAHWDESLQNLQHGWQRTPTGLPVGYHISNTYVSPLEYDASYGEFHRTTQMQFDDGHLGAH